MGKSANLKKNKCGVRQGCILSPDLYFLCSEIIVRNLEKYTGNEGEGHKGNNLRYAIETALTAKIKILATSLQRKAERKCCNRTAKRQKYDRQSEQ